MYLAIWFDKRAPTLPETVILVTPLLRDLNSAVSLLVSRRRRGADSMIVSGDGPQINRFVAQLEESARAWKSYRAMRESIRLIADRSGISIVPFGKEPARVAAIVVAKVTKGPKPGLYPRGLDKKARPIWDEVTDNYKKLIKRHGPDKQRMWAAAIILTKRVAADRGVPSFTMDPDKKHRRKMQTEVQRRINRGNAKALQAIERAGGILQSRKLASGLSKEKFYESAEHKGVYYITTFRTMRSKDPAGALDVLMEDWGGGQPGRYAHRPVDHVTDVLVEPVGQGLYFYATTRMTRDSVAILFGVEEGADSREVLRTLSAAGRRWVKTGVMKIVEASASFVALGFTRGSF